MKRGTAIVLLLLLSAMIAVADPKYISFPCPRCHDLAVVEVSTGTPWVEESGTSKRRITRVKRTCDDCGYYWYGSNAETIRR